MFRIIHIVLFFAALFAAEALCAQEVTPRIAGLEGNAEYMSLLRDDVRLQIREDSIVRAVQTIRTQLREQPQKRQEFTGEILNLENEIFSIRSSRGRLVDRINAIEQDWVLSSLESGRPIGGEASNKLIDVADSLKVPNLVGNLYFRENLPLVDYAALSKAQAAEQAAEAYRSRYRDNYEQLTLAAQAYADAVTEEEAAPLYEKFTTLERMDRVLGDSLETIWNNIFDNKSYAYNYILDKLGREDLLASGEQQLSGIMRHLSELQDEIQSKAYTDYLLRKQGLLINEIAVAELLQLDAARDSLRQVSLRLGMENAKLPKVTVQQRYFFDYHPVEFAAVTPYSYQNPIPECRVFPKGTIYRVLLGTFTSKRAASLFKGASPLCYQQNDEGKWLYFAGGFAARQDAEAAQKQLKTKGFLRPELVVWTDGAYRNLSRDPEVGVVRYRVEIIGVQALSEQVKQAITSSAEGYELSRVGQDLFVVGVFDDKELADRVAGAVIAADGTLEIKIAEIAAE